MAYVYIFTPVCAALLLVALGLLGNRPRSDASIYGFPKNTIRLVLFGLPILLALGAIMLLVSPRSAWKHPAADAAFAGCVLCAYLLTYLHVRSFFVQLKPNALIWGSIFYQKTLVLESIKRYAFIEGGRGGQILELRNTKNKIVFRVADSVQDFATLAADIRKQLRREGVVFARRDMWGKWSEESSRA
jgi:hypothetical protein